MATVRRLLGIAFLCDRTFWRASGSRRVGLFVALAGYLYLGPLLAVLALEDRFLFPGATFGKPWRDPPADLGVRDAWLDAGDPVHAWFHAPDGWEPRRGAVLVSHGNGGNVSRLDDRLRRWGEPFGRAVLVYDYPGYGKSGGWPSEAGCYAAGEAALRWLVEEQGVPVGEVILVGESMGGAVAIDLATRHPARLLVLHGAFTSFSDMAQVRFPFYPGRYLVRNRMANVEKIGAARCPVLSTHGTADTVVPYDQGERLFAAAAEPKRFLRFEGEGHSPPRREAFLDAVRAFLAETAR